MVRPQGTWTDCQVKVDEPVFCSNTRPCESYIDVQIPPGKQLDVLTFQNQYSFYLSVLQKMDDDTFRVLVRYLIIFVQS